MYISYNWLKDFVKIPSGTQPEEIAQKLTNHTVEVEGFIKQAEQFNKVVVGKVLSVEKHPNADRLRVTSVDVKSERLSIVCGAPNVAVGQLVPVALMGANLPNGLEIKESEIRGVKSYGMICAEDELGLGKDHEGIMVLGKAAKIGDNFADYLGANDIVFEVDNKSLSNRPDLLSHYGLARELAAIFSWPLKPYNKFFSASEYLSEKANKLTVKVEDKDLCPRYLGIKISNVEIKESPTWLKNRLIAVNQRPINNIVDLTNYVMMEIGQPLHAFDAAEIKKIVVRRARKHETFETLDEKERVLSSSDLMITDGQKSLAIAGIMGGKASGITDATTSLILEAANFQAAGIRKTSQSLGLRTEASGRFEKSLDPELIPLAAQRFVGLLKEMCPNLKIDSSLVDIDNSDKKIEPIDLDLNWLSAKIGQDIPREQVIGSLERLGFKVSDKKAGIIKVLPPSWRSTKDVKTREDLVEEVLRLHGYDNIASQLPVQTLNLPELNFERTWERKVKQILAWQHGLSEAYNYSFIGEDQANKLSIDFSNYLQLANPLADNQTLLRQSLAVGLIYDIKSNQFKADSLGFFEIGNVFFDMPGNLVKDESGSSPLPYQEKHLGLVMAGDTKDLFEKLKGLIANFLLAAIDARAVVEFSRLENAPGWADKKTAAKIILFGAEVGVLSSVDQAVKENLNLKKEVACAELNFQALSELVSKLPPFRFQEPPKYPAVIRDIAFVVDEKILYNDLREEIINFHPLLESAEIFDVYIGNKLADGQKSLAFHLAYRSDERTMTAEEVDAIQANILRRLAEKFSAQLRDF